MELPGNCVGSMKMYYIVSGDRTYNRLSGKINSGDNIGLGEWMNCMVIILIPGKIDRSRNLANRGTKIITLYSNLWQPSVS